MPDPRFLAATLADAVAGSRTIAVGTNSPIPAAAALLAQRRQPATVVSILGSTRHNPFTDGGRELFDFAAQGRLDSFFLGGGQIDGAGNVNLVQAGSTRFPGSYGSAYLMALVPNIVLFREEHSPRVLVPRVEFISAAGQPRRLVTGRAVFHFVEGRFVLVSAHPGESADGIVGGGSAGCVLAVRASQPDAAGKQPELFRSPTGVMADSSWRGQAAYDPGRITAPTLIIRGEWDELTPRAMSQSLFGQLRNAKLRTLTEIPRASHFIIAETGRDALFAEVQAFLARQR